MNPFRLEVHVRYDMPFEQAVEILEQQAGRLGWGLQRLSGQLVDVEAKIVVPTPGMTTTPTIGMARQYLSLSAAVYRKEEV